MKIGVSAYSFNRFFRDGSMTLADAVRHAAEIGFEGFEMLPRYFKAKEGCPGEARQLRDMLSDAGLELCCYTLSNNFGLPDGGERQAEIDRIMREIEVALVLGARTCRIESSFGPREGEDVTFDEMLRRVVRATREVADYALKYGIRLGLENHGRYLGSFHYVTQIIKDVNSSAYGAVPDIGNFFVVDEEPLIAVRELAKYAVHVHAKDFRRRPPGDAMPEGWSKTNAGFQIQGAVVGEGDVPVRECVEALHTRGYRGYLAIEHEAPEDPLEGLRCSRTNLEEMISSLS